MLSLVRFFISHLIVSYVYKGIFEGGFVVVLSEFLKQNQIQMTEVLKKIDETESQLENMSVIEYPDEWLYVVSRATKKKVSLILYELLQLENPRLIRKVNSDYALIKAFENEITYIYLPQTYRKGQTKLLTDILIEKNIFELQLGVLGKYNFIGKKIYEAFLLSTGKGEEYQRIEKALAEYFVLAHDAQGSLLCHADFIKNPYLK